MAQEPYIVPISNLNPYSSWTIKARVTFKSPIRTWHNEKGDGKLFHVDLVDSSGEIKCTSFNECVDLFEPRFKVNDVYLISKATLKAGNKRYTNAEYEMTLNKNSVVTPVAEPVQSIPTVRYNFTVIDRLQDIEPNTLVDVIGVISSVGDVSTFNSKKDNRPVTKRPVNIVDTTMRQVEITLWGEKAQAFDQQPGTVVAAKNLRIQEYMGTKTLGVLNNTQLDFDPATPEAQEMKQWFQENHDSISSSAPSISGAPRGGGSFDKNTPFGTLKELVDEASSSEGKTIFKKVFATITWIKHDEGATVYYKAVPLPDQRQKVVESGGRWHCPSKGEYYDSYIPRFILTAIVADHTSSQFVSIFDDFGSKILGADAKQVEDLKEGPGRNEQQFNNIFDSALQKRYLLKLKAKEEVYGDGPKMKIVVSGVEPVDTVQHANLLIQQIKEMM